MLDALWFGLIVSSVLAGAFTGRLGALSGAMLEGAKSAVEFSFSLLGSMCAWLGFLKIAEKSGLSALFARAAEPLIGRLFPEYRNDPDVTGKICLNLSANLLGLGNAATPLGLSAMKAMAAKNRGDGPTPGMILFVVLNTASIQLLPVNTAAMRAATGSVEPFGILPEIWLTSLGALTVCVAFCKLWERRAQR